MTIRLASISGLLLALAGIAGCAPLGMQDTADRCRATDWYEYGWHDSWLGLPAAARGGLFAACGRLGYLPDVEAYRAGRAAGLRRYCTAEGGYAAGREGRSYHHVCPPHLEAAFLEGYARGRRARPAYSERYQSFGIAPGHRPYYRDRHWQRRRYYDDWRDDRDDRDDDWRDGGDDHDDDSDNRDDDRDDRDDDRADDRDRPDLDRDRGDALRREQRVIREREEDPDRETERRNDGRGESEIREIEHDRGDDGGDRDNEEPAPEPKEELKESG